MSDFSTIPPEIPKKRTGKARTFSCPNCGGSVTVKAVGLSISAVCAYCSSVIDIANDNFRILATANERTRPTALTIGSKGALNGILWEIVGYMEKSDSSEFYRWDEYLLYNPYQGFRFLVQSQGHWSLYKVLKKSVAEPNSLSGDFKFEGRKYECFQKGATKVLYVKGEFYWRVRKGEESYVTDYIAPPFMLSIDQGDEDINLALGEYIEPKAIEKAFVLTAPMPERIGVGPNQPGRYQAEHVAKVWFSFAVAFAFATFIQIMSAFTAHSKVVYENSYELDADSKNKTISTELFNLPRQSNVEISNYASLDNEWLELDMALVNAKDETIKETKQALEYYSGMDYDGYYWKEGDADKDSVFSAVPEGDYRVLIDADFDAYYKRRPVVFRIKIKRDVSNWSNYGFTLLLLILYPAYVTFRHTHLESARWSKSDYSYFNWH